MSITINGTTGIAGVDGSAATPSVQGADANTGVFFPAADTVALTTGGTERLRVTSAGLVGIGTTPTTLLHLSGSSAAGQDPTVTLANTTATTGRTYQIISGDGGPFRIQDGTAAAERMRIDSSGNVGIGVSNPEDYRDFGPAPALVFGNTTGSSQATIVSGTTSEGNLTFADGTTGNDSYRGIIRYNHSGDYMGFFTAATERMRVDSSGNVGINTSTPSKKLEVYAASASLQINSIVKNDTAGAGVAAIGFNVSSSGAGEATSTKAGIGLQRNFVFGGGFLCFYNNNSGAAGDFTTADERMRIDGSGDLFMGTTSSILTTARLTVQATGSSGIISATSTNVNLFCVNTNAATWDAISFRYNTSTEVGKIRCTSTATTYTTSSDYRLKENVQPMVGALDKIAQLNPVTYNWKSDGSDGQGFIAHELQAVVPDCVTGEKDAVDADGKPQHQGVDTSFLVATLVKAVQEQQAIITALEARIAALEAK